MASLLHLLFILFITFLLISPAISHNCSSQSFSNNVHFDNCTHLPTLKSSLHWTYNSTKSTLSFAFIAPLPSSNGWISWGINKIAPAMIGTQCFIAFKGPNGSMVVKTYNLTSYNSITQTNELLFTVLDSKAEYSDGVMKILATLVLPSNMTTINQVWQVGPAVKDGTPVVHKFDSYNLKSKGTLNLATSSGGGKNATAPVPAGSGGGQSGDKASGSSRIWSNEAIFYVSVIVLGILFL